VNDRDVMLACVGAGVLVLGFLLTKNTSQEQPRFQPNRELDGVMVMGGIAFDSIQPVAGVGDHFLEPEYHIEGTRVLPIRYPTRCGHNISTIIHQGWSAMSKARPQDSDWAWSPPSEDDL
jgi:hypothetical protein